MSLRGCNSGVRRRASACLYYGRKPGRYGTVTPFARVLVPILGDCRKFWGQAAIAIGGYRSLSGRNFCPKSEPRVPL
jgi:hypothetical protein